LLDGEPVAQAPAAEARFAELPKLLAGREIILTMGSITFIVIGKVEHKSHSVESVGMKPAKSLARGE
jgi:hypothetical protein